MNSEILRIKLDLVRREITQRRLAQKLGWDDTKLSNILRGVKTVTEERIAEIRKALDEMS